MIRKAIFFIALSLTFFTNQLLCQETANTNEMSVISSNYNIIIKEIKYPKKNVFYSYYIDDLLVQPEVELEGYKINIEYQFTVLDDNDFVVYNEITSSSNTLNNILDPSEKWDKNNYYRIAFLNESWISFGIDHYFNRYLWLGYGLGLSYWREKELPANFFIISPYIEIGHYFIGDRMTDYRIGLGVGVKNQRVYPKKDWETIINSYYDEEYQIPTTVLKNKTYTFEVIATAEWKLLFFNLSICYDIHHPKFNFIPTIGIKF